MKINKKAILLAFITTFSLVGCSHRSDDNVVEKEEYSIVSTPVIVETPNIEVTNTPIVNPIPTPIPTPEPTINPVDIFNPIENYAYITETCNLYSSYKDEMYEIISIEKYQKVFVVASNNEYYKVITEDDYTGYVLKNNIELLPENYVEVDLSSQRVFVFDEYKEVLNCDVVTGAPGHETNEGYTEILEKTYNRPLVGPTWNVDVSYFFPFNYSEEGFHDASWRSDFGGDIHTYSGSHGCVNMQLEDVKTMDEYVEIGTKVLVHK